MYENMKILILGAGKSGISVAKLLVGRNNKITLCDINSIDENIEKELKNLGINIIITTDQCSLLDDEWDLVIKNPAIMYTSDIIKKCDKLNLRVENEMEVAYHFLPKDITIIGVTGSNGKTTTTALIEKMLECGDNSVVVGGNIGRPLSDVIKDVKIGDILLLEISDHQLCDFHDFKTDISVLTNISPTHIDYHGTYDHYKSTKLNIFNRHTSLDYAIINEDNLDAYNETKDIISTKEYFSTKDYNANAYLKDNYIYLNNEKIINVDDIKIKGVHNYENILAALLVVSKFNMNIEKIKEFLHCFTGVEHRLEFVKNVDGVDYYNDSKSTNPSSTVIALKTFDRPVHLILGGLDRHLSYDELSEYLGNVECIYGIGQTTDEVCEFAKKNNIKYYKCYKLSTAMEEIKENVKIGDVVLLSPASSSQDQYPHFEDRGNEFKNIVINY